MSGRSLDQDTGPKDISTSEHDSNGNCTSNVSFKQPEGGIKLFGASAAFLASCNITPPPQTKRRKRGRKFACISSESEDDFSSNEADTSNTSYKDSSVKADWLGLRDETELSERFAACAVSSDWILNGDAVKGWAPPFNSKEPLQGQATPDLLKVVQYKREKSKKRCKKEKPLNEEPVLNKKRGKRGGSKKKKVKENGNSENGENPLDIADSLTTELKKSDTESRQVENNLENMEKQIARKYRKLKVLCRKFACEYAKEKGIEGALSVAVQEKKKKRKKKKKRREAELKPLWISKDDVKDTLKELQKKERKLRRRELQRDQLDLPVVAAAPAEDEGFDSDPTKTDKGNSEERKQLQSDKNGWQNNMEFLSVDLANLVMTNVKQD